MDIHLRNVLEVAAVTVPAFISSTRDRDGAATFRHVTYVRIKVTTLTFTTVLAVEVHLLTPHFRRRAGRLGLSLVIFRF